MKNFCAVVILTLISVLPAYAGKWSTGTTAPATCTVGDSWTDTNGTADNRFYTCTSANTWTLNSNQTAIDAKANKVGSVMSWSEWGDGASFTPSSPPVAYNGSLYKCTAPYTKVAGETPDTQTEYFAEVTGSGGGIAHATSDGAYYASRNGAWANLSGVFAAPLGADDNYVTDAEKIKLGSLSGTNTGDQDLSGYALTSSVLSKNNTTAFTPTADYHPATKKYVDDSITVSGGYTDDQTAAEVPITDSGGYYTATTVEEALAERGADPLIHFDTATITEVENSPVAGTNTISVKSGVFQAYDSNMIPWPSAISATEVEYLDGLGGTLTTLLAAKAPLSSPVFTDSVALPQGTAPTVDAAGEIAIDTTSDQLVYYGGAKRVLTYKKDAPFTIKSPVDADDFLLGGPVPSAITVTGISLNAQGGGSIGITVQECDGDGVTNCGDIAGQITADGGTDSASSITAPSIESGHYFKIVSTAPTGTVNFLSGSIYYVETSD